MGLDNYWTSNTKLTLLVQESRGELNLITFDPEVGEITNIKIPSNTEVEVARRYGVFRLGNVWELGYSEGLRGDLLANTITKNFKLPVYTWADSQAVGFVSTNYFDVGRAVISRYRTNLKIGDRIRIAAFVFRIPNSRRVEINLSDTQYLKKTKLIDGEEGYVIVRNIPVSILSVFAEPMITKNGYRAERNRRTEATIAQGRAEAMRIKTDADSKRIELLAAAEARAKAIRGQGDAEAAEYYKMLDADPDLAIFLRKIEVLKKILEKRATIVLSADTEPLDLLRGVPALEPKK